MEFTTSARPIPPHAARRLEPVQLALASRPGAAPRRTRPEAAVVVDLAAFRSGGRAGRGTDSAPAPPAAQERAGHPVQLRARHLLLAIRAAIGVAFLACGLGSVCQLLPAAHAAVLPASGLAAGGAIMLGSSLLSLLKGAEVLLAAALDTFEQRRHRPE